MFDEVFVLIKNKLNSFFNSYIENNGGGNGFQEYVAFLEGEKIDPLVIQVNKVTPILVNIEEEKVLRMNDRYEGSLRNGKRTDINPSIRVNMLILFVSKFSNYEQSLKFLSLIIKCFQNTPVFNHENTPTLNPEIERLRMELITLPINQQNELWNALRTNYHPSVVYKVNLLVFHDDLSEQDYYEVEEIIVKPPIHLNTENNGNNSNL
ncbi:MAG: hypothetical protein A3D31_05130 [Candidatus Fluviicola riflensis]|nr:MAG: hypothetical protein CHH17_09885 [Candidatus Fluviicola riflensis]OGS79357.1 MAG: hypothetical protein A3D31_05130 [Candidatus Fluviicola riflensis]OGS86789.1 MAG: hypothetical protein A2724_04590 [Fluviicola sp. RIFCSPHIGHO2_01_FULL_43_53]OGS88738.1 MAG: hypothetical protein A3E30_00070 [Fluviicola sp. RIFCSPHIGHO2_12_FULL_43_24]